MVNKQKALAVAVAAALAVPMAAHAVKYSLSGQTTQALYLIDTGKQSDYQFGGGGFTYSRLELKGAHDIDNGMKVGFHWEVQHYSDFPQFKGDGGGSTAPAIRHMNMSLTGGFGKLTLGQASQANDGAAYGDLGGASWMALEASCDHATNTLFRDAGGSTDVGGTEADAVTELVTGVNGNTFSNTVTAAVAGTSISVLGVCPSYDGGRDNGLRYDSPAGAAPVNFTFSAHNRDKWTAMVQGGGEAPGNIGWDARFGYQDSGSAASFWAASGGLKFPAGTSINVMHGQSDRGTGNKTIGWYAKLAHDVDPQTTVALSYRTNKDIWNAACSDKGNYCSSNGYGVGGTRALGDSGATVIVGFQRHSVDDTNVAADDINMFYVATRVRFN